MTERDDTPGIPNHLPDDIQGTGFFLPDEYEVLGRLWMVFVNATALGVATNALRLVSTALRVSLSFKALHDTNAARATQLAMFAIVVMQDQHLVQIDSPNFKRVTERKDLDQVPKGYDPAIEPIKGTDLIAPRIMRAFLNAHYWSNRADIPPKTKRSTGL